jgi:hypothetical protein
MAYFFEFIWKIKTRRFKTNLTLSLILQFNLRLEGYSIWSANFIALHIKEDYSGHEHLTTLRHPSKYSEDTLKMEFGRTRRRLQNYSEACSTRLRRVWELVRPGATGLRTWHEYSRIRDGHVPYLILVASYWATSRTSRNRRKLPE